MREEKEKCLERDSKRIVKERKRRNGKGGRERQKEEEQEGKGNKGGK